MYRHAAVVSLLVAAGCGDGDDIGTELVCSPGGPRVVLSLVATRDQVIAIDFAGFDAHLYEPAQEVWRPLTGAPNAVRWTLTEDDRLLAINDTGLYRSVDVDTWERIGPGHANWQGGHGQGLFAATTDGSYWMFPDSSNAPTNGVLQRLRPGATAWEDAGYGTGIREGLMAPDRSIWLFSSGTLIRVAPDGGSVETVLDCQAPELLFCTAGAQAIAFNTDGDLFYYLRNDQDVVHRFYQLDTSTRTVVERGRLVLDDEDLPLGYATSIAASGENLYLTARGQNAVNDGFLYILEPGESTPRKLAQLNDRNAMVKTSSDGKRVYTYSPGVCELR